MHNDFEGASMAEPKGYDFVPISAPVESRGGQDTSGNYATALLIVIGLMMYQIYQSLEAWAENQERRHNRAQLLAAYRRRRDWKKSDIPHLKSLGVNEVAQRRMESLV